MTGKVSLLTFEGSGYRSTADGPGFLELNLYACPGSSSAAPRPRRMRSLLVVPPPSARGGSHKELSIVLPFEVPAGAYTIGLVPAPGTTTDGTDYYQVSVVSLG